MKQPHLLEPVPPVSEHLRLPGGRRLGYRICGSLDGIPIFHLHGTPGSSLEAALVYEYVGRSDVCIIGIDRPGYGRSDTVRGWKIPQFPGDLIAIADHLGLEFFILMAYSGGGPFAIACAHQVPGRLRAVGIISSLGPPGTGSQGMHAANRGKFDLAQNHPWLVKLMIRIALSSVRRSPQRLEQMLQRTWAHMPEPDRLVLQDQRFRDWMVRETLDALSNGSAGLANEEVLLASDWGFDLAQVSCPKFFLWHGKQDRNVPLAMGKALAAAIPGCRAQFFEAEGHLSLIYTHGKQIVDTLIQAAC